MSYTTTDLSTNVIIAAGGDGIRMGRNKQLMRLGGKSVIARTLEAFQNHPLIDRITLVRPPILAEEFRAIAAKYNISKLAAEADSGPTRMESIHNGLQKTSECAVVIVHNGANPFVTETEITACIKATLEYGAAVVAQPVKDTIKVISKNGFVMKTLKRAELWAMQTPQGMQYKLAKDAYTYVINQKIECTDDVQALELFHPQTEIKIVPASLNNFKLTTPVDVMLAETILSGSGNSFEFQIGNGEDSHFFTDSYAKMQEERRRNEKGKKGKGGKNAKEDPDLMIRQGPKALVIGGAVIPNMPGFHANSDGDVVYHAITRAISAAIGGPSIGYFADELAKESLTDSKIYLISAKGYIEEKGFDIQNVSVIVEGKRPLINDHIPAMKKNIGQILGISEQQIGISPHSGEGLTDFGRGLGMRAEAVVLLKRRL